MSARHRCGSPLASARRLRDLGHLLDLPLSVALVLHDRAKLQRIGLEAEALAEGLSAEGRCTLCGRLLQSAAVGS